MDDDEPTRGGYKDALLSAAGKRDRPKAPTGLTPPAKAPPGRIEESAQQGEEQAEMRLEDLSMEEETHPQWSADEDDEALLKEAAELGTTQHEEPKERASASGAKRSLELIETVTSSQTQKNLRSRDEARVYPVYLAPRDPNLVIGKHLPLHTAAEAMARALLTEWNINDLSSVMHRGAEATAVPKTFKVAINEEELAMRLRLYYSDKTKRSIMVRHKDNKGTETDIPYICVKELVLKENGAERITVEVFTTGDYKINTSDITTALKEIGLIITSGRTEVHQPTMAPTCPLISNKNIIRVTPPGHTSLKDGTLTLRDAAHAFRWPKNLMVKTFFEGEDEPHRVQLRYKIYGDGLIGGELELCRTCHKHNDHLRDCPNRQKTKRSRKAKMFEFSRKIIEENKSGNQCSWFALGLCSHQRECRLAHDKEVDPGLIPCALPRASKDQMNEWGLPIEVPMCKAGKQCFYHHRGWTTESSKAAYAAIEEEPSILA